MTYYRVLQLYSFKNKKIKYNYAHMWEGLNVSGCPERPEVGIEFPGASVPGCQLSSVIYRNWTSVF